MIEHGQFLLFCIQTYTSYAPGFSIHLIHSPTSLLLFSLIIHHDSKHYAFLSHSSESTQIYSCISGFISINIYTKYQLSPHGSKKIIGKANSLSSLCYDLPVQFLQIHIMTFSTGDLSYCIFYTIGKNIPHE